jgi:hypothetical protein
MAATNRYRNNNVTWTPSGGTVIPLTGIKTVSYDEGNQVLEESADSDAYHTVGTVVLSSPKITVDSIDAMALFATLAGTRGTIAVTLRDHLNGATAGGGAKLITMSNAYLGPRTLNSPYNQLAHQSLTFHSISLDGQTHPVAITLL